jgi:deglycase
MAGRGPGHIFYITLLFSIMFFLLIVEALAPLRVGDEGRRRAVSGCISWQSRRVQRACEKVLLVIPPSDFTDREYRLTREGLECHGFKVEVASTALSEAWGQEGTVVVPDVTIYEVSMEDYAAVVFIGGGGAEGLFDDTAALELAREADLQGKTVGAICLAPVILAEAGVLRGRRATAIPSVERRMVDGGAEYVYEDVVVDGNIVTSCAPHASRAFGKKLADNIEP